MWLCCWTDASKSLPVSSKPTQLGHRGGGGGLAHSFGVGSLNGGGSTIPGGGSAPSAQLLKEQQEAERRKALQHVQNFLNPQNKPPAKTAIVSGNIPAAETSSSASKASEHHHQHHHHRKGKDDK